MRLILNLFIGLLLAFPLASCGTSDHPTEIPIIETSEAVLEAEPVASLPTDIDTEKPVPGFPENPIDPSLAGLPLLNQSALIYIGAFRVPEQDAQGNSLAYGGHALGYNAVNHSLFFGGHAWDQKLCEIGIPEVIDLGQTAAIIQNCQDVTEGGRARVDDSDVFLGGTMVDNNRLIVSVFSYYDADETQTLSHFASSIDLSLLGEVKGPYQVGDWAGIVSGYMTLIPPGWQLSLGGNALTGNCCIPIVSRTSFGPAISVFNPADVGNTNPVPANPLLYYPADHPLAGWDAESDYFNGSTKIVGVAFPPSSRSILFFGVQGTGRFCYGTGEECNDPIDDSKGTHAYPYIHQVWAYDALDLLAVKNGQMQPWEVKPYALWKLDEMNSTGGATISGAAYDPIGGRIYITEMFAETPLVHVYQLDLN